MKILIILGLMFFVASLLLFIYCACVVSSICSREEEKFLNDKEELK